jgi:hypothetical protein
VGQKVGQKQVVQKIGYFTFQINSVVNLFYISKKWSKKWGKTLYLINFEIKVIK